MIFLLKWSLTLKDKRESRKPWKRF